MDYKESRTGYKYFVLVIVFCGTQLLTRLNQRDICTWFTTFNMAPTKENNTDSDKSSTTDSPLTAKDFMKILQGDEFKSTCY